MGSNFISILYLVEIRHSQYGGRRRRERLGVRQGGGAPKNKRARPPGGAPASRFRAHRKASATAAGVSGGWSPGRARALSGYHGSKRTQAKSRRRGSRGSCPARRTGGGAGKSRLAPMVGRFNWRTAPFIVTTLEPPGWQSLTATA